MRPCVRPFTFSKIFSETAWPIKAKFYVQHPWVGGTKVCVFYLDRIRTLVLLWQLEVSIDLYGEKWKLAFSIVRLGIFEFCFYINVY